MELLSHDSNFLSVTEIHHPQAMEASEELRVSRTEQMLPTVVGKRSRVVVLL